MEITKDYLDRWLSKLATADDLAEVKSDLKEVKQTLNQHTNTLDAILKPTKDWNAEMTVMRNRMERYESALKLVAAKVKIDLQSLLN